MVAKWSNPSCSASFRYLEEGRLFRLEKDPAPRSSKVAAAKYFWLCPSCSSTMTLHLSEDGSVIPVVLREPVHNSGDFWWQAWQKNSCCVIKPPCNAGAKESCPSLQVGREVGFRNYRLKASQSSRCCAPRRVAEFSSHKNPAEDACGQTGFSASGLACPVWIRHLFRRFSRATLGAMPLWLLRYKFTCSQAECGYHNALDAVVQADTPKTAASQVGKSQHLCGRCGRPLN